jgi:ribosomal protein S18 acetylase RimI-like enzyme
MYDQKIDMTGSAQDWGIEIRFLTADDAEAYSAVRLEALERDPEAFSSSAEEHKKLTLSEIKIRLTGNPPNNFVAGVFKAGRLLGTAGFYRETGPKVRHKGHIWGVYLAVELRGKGIGRQMMQAVIERAEKLEGLEQILISVAATQTAAIALYRALGFVSFGTEPRALNVNGQHIDEIYMSLSVDRTSCNPNA